MVNGSAHHLDLRLPNDQADPEDVKLIRQQEIEVITQWVYKY